MALIAGLPAGPFGRLPWHRATSASPRMSRPATGATSAVVLGWLTVLIAAVTAGLAA